MAVFPEVSSHCHKSCKHASNLNFGRARLALCPSLCLFAFPVGSQSWIASSYSPWVESSASFVQRSTKLSNCTMWTGNQFTSALFAAVLGLVVAGAFIPASAFSTPATHYVTRTTRSTDGQLSAVAPPPNPTSKVTSGAPNSIDDLKMQILDAIDPTKRGLSATADQRSLIESKIRVLEGACPLVAPARDSRMAGGWEVLYTTAPPPSNGQLGPFVGVAKQFIDLEGGGYSNILQVGENNWLSAVLDASWEEWDGSLLVDKGGGEKWREAVVEINDDEDGSAGVAGENDASSNNAFDGLMNMFGGQNKAKEGTDKTPDYGAKSWKVDFKTITISLFGFPLLSKTFPEDTARVWKMTCECFLCCSPLDVFISNVVITHSSSSFI